MPLYCSVGEKSFLFTPLVETFDTLLDSTLQSVWGNPAATPVSV